MSSPYAPPPTETPSVIPPNRVAPRGGGGRTLALWLVMMVGLYAVYQVGRQPGAPHDDADAAPGHALGLLLPLLTYGGMGVGLWVLRRRLPARYRTGELREIPAAAPPAPPAEAGPPPPIDLTLIGRDDARPVRLHVDDAGLHWHADARLLRPAQELHMAWSELQGLVPFTASSGPWMMLGVFGSAGASLALPDAVRPLGALVVVAAVMMVVLRATRRRGLAITTATHVLRFQSRQLDLATQERILDAARARAARAVPAPATPGRGALRMLFLEPFVQLAGLARDDATIHAEMGATPIDAETTRASVTQWRLFSLWSGVMRGAGPVAAAIGVGLASGTLWPVFSAWILAWVLGLVVVTRATVAFARFAGMSVVRPG